MRVALGVIFLGFSLYTNADTIEFPACVEGEVLNTEVHLYIDESMLLEYSKAFIASKVATWESYSNLVLKN
nr:hypothetical protein [Vibrio crassostreae]